MATATNPLDAVSPEGLRNRVNQSTSSKADSPRSDSNEHVAVSPSTLANSQSDSDKDKDNDSDRQAKVLGRTPDGTGTFSPHSALCIQRNHRERQSWAAAQPFLWFLDWRQALPRLFFIPSPLALFYTPFPSIVRWPRFGKSSGSVPRI